MRILVADDDQGTLLLLGSTLAKLGHEVISCQDGAEAWEAFLRQPVSVVVSDWMMPELDGLDLCRRIRSRTSTEYAYFLLLTVRSADRESYREAMDAGVDDFMVKPLDPETIWLRLRAAERILSYTSQIFDLKSLLPICMYCKRIRDDENYWRRIEEYIRDHTGTEFSHGICPECYESHALKQFESLEKPES